MRAAAACGRVAVLARLRRAWRAFHRSLLFMPTLLTVAALVLFALTSYIDAEDQATLYDVIRGTGSGTLGFLVFAGSAESARSLLASIAGTWASIVGVVYSVTLVTIQLSATKYSAQVIPIFERDRINQWTLGVFTATFAYALLVLKTVRSPGDDGGGAFVPLVGVNVSVVLALTSLFLLIAFIGNLTAYIRPKRFVDDLALEAVSAVPERDPPDGLPGYRKAGRGTSSRAPALPATVVTAAEEGYLRDIDWARLREALRSIDPRPVRVEILAGAGRYVSQKDALLRLVGGEAPEGEALDRLREAFPVDDEAEASDVRRAANTLADIAETAMSGGATDVGVAEAATRALLRLTARVVARPESGEAFLVDLGEGELLVTVGSSELADDCLRQLRRITGKASREAYWEVGEAFTRHVGPTLMAAAREDHERAWKQVLAWLRLVVEQLLRTDDPHARQAMLRDLALVARALREEGEPSRHRDLETTLLQAARAAGPEREREAAEAFALQRDA